MYELIIKFIIGGILILLLDYLAKNKDNRLCSIIPALPILSLIGLYFTYIHKGNIKNYTWNLIIYMAITVIFLSIMFLLLRLSKYGLILVLFIAMIIWIFLIYISQLYIYD